MNACKSYGGHKRSSLMCFARTHRHALFIGHNLNTPAILFRLTVTLMSWFQMNSMAVKGM